MTLKIRILNYAKRLFIILVGLTVTLFSEKMLISSTGICGFMPNSIKKSVTVSTCEAKSLVKTGFSVVVVATGLLLFDDPSLPFKTQNLKPEI